MFDQVVRWLTLLAMLIGAGPGAAPVALAAAPAAAPEAAAAVVPVTTGGATTLRLSVVSARTVGAAELPPAGTGPSGKFLVNAGDAVPAFKWIINEDNSGDPFQPRFPDCSPYYETAPGSGVMDYNNPNLNYPKNCNWPSIRAQQAYAPIVAQGTEAEFASGAGVAGLADGKYLISVTAENFKIDGAHFLVKNGYIYPSDITPTAVENPYASPAPNGLITVGMQPLPTPTATLRARLFRDHSIVNGMFDSPAEDGNGMVGWTGHLSDVLAEVTVDVFGNPLCTEYYRDDAAALTADDLAVIRAANPTANPQYVPGNTGLILFGEDGAPIIKTMGSGCLSDANGDLAIPNMGPGRYAYWVTPPADQIGRWVQTSTLEGNHDYDTWVLEGATGFDTEFVNQAEPFPWTIFGYVDRYMGKNALVAGQVISVPTTAVLNANPVNNLVSTGRITGVVAKTKVYVPMTGGLPYLGSLWGGLSGAKPEAPIPNAWVTLTSLQAGDQIVLTAQADANGKFDLQGVPDGDYTLTYWDEPQMTLLDLLQVSVVNGQAVDVGTLMVAGWFASFSGHVFLDMNENGRMDANESGVDNLTLVVRKRSNALIDRGAIAVTTTGGGHWFAENTYPMTNWHVIELYSDAYRNTGYTFQADNQPEETVISPGAVDVAVLPIIGQSGRLDIGVKPYDPGTNGGIAGTVSYGTTRNELDPRHLAIENWQTGIPNLNVKLYAPVACTDPNTQTCDADGLYQLDVDGSYKRSSVINETTTEQFQAPTNCTVRDVDGNPLVAPLQRIFPVDPNAECLEGPISGIQFGQTQQSLDGNWGFGDACFLPNGAPGEASAEGVCASGTLQPLPAGDYIVEVVVPTTTVTLDDGAGNLTTVTQPLYIPTREEDINVFSGSSFVPQQMPAACVGPLHTVDVAGLGADGPNAVVNPTFAAEGGSPYEGQQRPLCNMKLVPVQDQKSVAPVFELFTPVPIPGRNYGYIVDDLNLTTDPTTLFFGEKAGVKHSPVGLYDFTNRIMYTVYSDPNGVYEPLMPATETINCPSPSGVCAGMFRHIGNDPGQPARTGRLNPHYDPQFRTISANFELYPGDITISDLAPTQIGVSIQSPGSQTHAAVQCTVADTTPQLFAVDRPYVYGAATAASRQITIQGKGFLTAQTGPVGSPRVGRVTLTAAPGNAPSDTGLIPLTVVGAWSENTLTVRVPLMTAGVYQLQVENYLGNVTTNGITLHVLGSGYLPTLFEVNPPAAPPAGLPVTRQVFASNPVFDPLDNPIQTALDAVAALPTTPDRNLVVVYPNPVFSTFNPTQAYFTNLLIHSSVKLQGVGPGGTYTDGNGNQTIVPGSVINGNGFGGDTAMANSWRTQVAGLTWAGDQQVYEGAVMTVLVEANELSNTANNRYRAAIDGFTIEGGDQLGFPGNINQIGGGNNGLPAVVETQGGGIFVNGYARRLQITNNILRSNGGAYGGAVRLGTPNLGAAWDNQNDNVVIARNQILANGGTNLAGALGIFQGSDGYEVAWNHICGNFTVEYGGGISHYGRSLNGRIHHNRIYFNRSMDEGGGIMIAGELPANPATLSTGAGSVDIYDNIIQSNLANDDGGGLRFLMAASDCGNPGYQVCNINVFNNIIANNISTHEGGGVSLNDAPNIAFYQNTVVKNLTTATALTSNGQPAPAGLATTPHSLMLQAQLVNATNYDPSATQRFALNGADKLASVPMMFGNLFWDNRAGSYNLAGGVSGIGLPGDLAPINVWDIGDAFHRFQLPIYFSMLSTTPDSRDYTTGPVTVNLTTYTNNLKFADVDGVPQFTSTFDTTIEVLPWRGNPRFAGATIVAQDVPPTMMGNYHLEAGSPAVNASTPFTIVGVVGGMTSRAVVTSSPDIDGDFRTGGATTRLDIGADELGARNFFILVLPDSQAYDMLYLPTVQR
ncbi:MAG: carboxypeptidase regulatory-like domain-containing protein [Anaerolineales bacterium]|nr:carboxypeptidase regulatory-like domain-containing protein [Anaerolineales bacterium]